MKHTKRTLCIAIVFAMMLALLPTFAFAYTEASGTYGSYVTWELDYGVLTITGTGAGTMANQTNWSDYPWATYKDEIEEIYLYNVASVPNNAFTSYPNLNCVEIDSSICRSIGEYAFEYCSELYEVDVSSGTPISTIGRYAFSECTDLEYIDGSASWTSIGNYAFYGCYALWFYKLNLTNVSLIGNYAFYDCYQIQNVNITGVSGASFGEYMFFNCTGLKSVTIDAPKATIGDKAFMYCSALSSVTIKGDGMFNATTIGEQAFYGCSLLKFVELHYCSWKSNTFPSDVSIVDDAHTVGVNINDGEVSLSVGGNSTLATGSTLKSDVIINYFYMGRNALKNIPINYDYNKVNSVLRSSYNDSRYIVTVPDNTVLPDRFLMFAEGAGGLDLTLGGITKFVGYGDMAFAYSTVLAPQVVIPSTITSVGSQAFYECDAITSLTFPGNIETVPYGLAANCDALTTVTIEEGVKELDSRCFSFDPSLTTVNLPSTIEYIGLNAFAGASDDLTIYYNGSRAMWNAIGGKASQWTDKVVFLGGNSEELTPDSVILSWTSSPYSGAVQKPTVQVINCEGETLTEGTAYTLAWSSGCKLPGVHQVKVKGIGDYMGELTRDFTITKQTLTDACVTLSWTSKEYNGSVQKPTVTVKNAQDSTLTVNTSYTLKWNGECKEDGVYSVTVTGKGNYNGSVTKEFSIVDSSREELSPNRVTLSWTSKPYNAAVQQPTVTVKNAAGTKLTLNRSYKVTYQSESKLPNTYTLTIEGMGNYRGSFTREYTITKQTLTEANTTLSWTTKEYSGAVQKPKLTVKNAQDSKLTLNTSYTVIWPSGCKYPNTYSVTIKGKGNYDGEFTKTFTITKQTLTAANVTLSPAGFTYNGKVQKPTVTVTAAQGTVLSEGGSYTVTWPSGCKAKGTYNIRIVGKGYYTGDFTVSYTIS